MPDLEAKHELGGALFAILSGIAALCLTARLFTPDRSKATSVPKAEYAIAEIKDLSSRLEEAEATVAEESRHRTDLADELGKSRAEAEQWQDRLVALQKAQAETLQDVLVTSQNRQARLQTRLTNTTDGRDRQRAEFTAEEKYLNGRITALEQKLQVLGRERNELARKAR